MKSTANGCFGWKMADCFVEPLRGVDQSNSCAGETRDVSQNSFNEIKTNLGN